MDKHINEKIFELMRYRGLSQKEFSKLTGIPESTISDWKHKNFNPTSDRIAKICEVLRVSTSELLETEDNEDDEAKYYLTEDEVKVLEAYRKADKNEKKYLLTYVEKLMEMMGDN